MAAANIPVAIICTIRFVMIDAPENPEKTNAKVIIKKNNIIIDSRDKGDNVIKDLLPFSFQFFTRLSSMFSEEISDLFITNNDSRI